MLNYIKNTFTNFASYMLGLKEQLKNAKDDATRVKILTLMVEAHRKQNEELEDENKRLKEQIKELESEASTNLIDLKNKVLRLKSSVQTLKEATIETPPKNK